MNGAVHGWPDEVRDLMRGIGGAAIIGIPLVYTMEMWQLATLLVPRTVFILALMAIIVNIGYNYTSGFRKGGGLRDALFDAVESYALGAVFSLLLMALLRIVDQDTPRIDLACKVAIEAIPLSIGISIANTQFAGSRTNGAEGDNAENPETTPGTKPHPTLVEAGISVAGAIVFAFNVAPTEEIILLASRATWLHLVALIIFSLLLSYGMIFVAEFSGREQRLQTRGFLQSPLGETLLAYLLSLLVASGMVYAFHSLSFSESPYTLISAVVVLGLPATVGAAAGRLIV